MAETTSEPGDPRSNDHASPSGTAGAPGSYPSSSSPPAETPTPPEEHGGHGESWRTAFSHLHETLQYAEMYIASRIDALKIGVRNVAIVAVLAIAGLILLVGLLVTTIVLTVIGIAGALGQLFHSVWVGDLVAGVGVLALIALSVYVGVRMMVRSSRERIRRKYDAWHERIRTERNDRDKTPSDPPGGML